MCGFTVLLGADAPLGEGVARALGRRGPDVCADHHDPARRVSVVAARLVHWTEGAAQQPYLGADGTIAVFNGELFNLPELQAHLGRPGASEIEVLALGVAREGAGFWRRIDGQFACVVITPSGQVHAARDRFGICPLFFSRRAGRLVLASNLESVAAATGEPARLSAHGLAGILDGWAPIGGRTPFAGVEQLTPGQALRADGARVEDVFSWVPPLPPPDTEAVDDEGFAGLEAILRASVHDRLRSTTPVACCVSGGIDSTVVAALATEVGVRTALGLVLRGDHAVRDRQRQVAATLDLDLIQHELTPLDAVATLQEYVATRRMPLVRLGPVGMTSLARRARAEGVRAVLSGEGADELFAGYDSYRILAARAGLFGPPASLPWAQFGPPEFGASRGPSWHRAYWRGLVALSTASVGRRAGITAPVEGLLTPGLAEAITAARAQDAAPAATTLVQRRAEDLRDLLGAYLLTVQGDHAWLEQGVELRPPLLSAGVEAYAVARDPARNVSLATGKLPVRGILQRFAASRPALGDLGFAKEAFRVDVGFVLSDPVAADRLAEVIAACPTDLMDTAGLARRFAACRAAGSCSEAESMIFLFAASLGVLASLVDVAPGWAA